ncbi:hypothetical protein YOLOSWAG_165 [Erwinia phage vB_EamM_Yoloswag]|uniref:Uncharacterized protein n=1 Tax=Erwinia phage vB_EamM_Yoloswag TaxID=1958956 RepID=A0A1S6L3P1_9CAUD|nr:hypothetical protein HOR66_gp165 [Erwinia phage vB_EamM_Yoloswag]AQT28805.1 hypothetical protein YOLOSWAG_165 [Erwinia phage vB_EamM_Yoloswag]
MIHPFRVKKGLLLGDLSNLMQDFLHEIEAPRGRRMFVLVNKPIYGHQLRVDTVAPISHSHHFNQSYLRLADNVVGSLLDISARWCKFSNLGVGYMPPQDKITTFVCPTEAQSGGLLVYNDGHGCFYATPAKVPSSPLLISDRGD